MGVPISLVNNPISSVPVLPILACVFSLLFGDIMHSVNMDGRNEGRAGDIMHRVDKWQSMNGRDQCRDIDGDEIEKKIGRTEQTEMTEERCEGLNFILKKQQLKIFLIEQVAADDANEESLNTVTQVFVNARGEVTVVVVGGFRQLVEFGIAIASQCSYSPDSSTATILHEKTALYKEGENTI